MNQKLPQNLKITVKINKLTQTLVKKTIKP